MFIKLFFTIYVISNTNLDDKKSNKSSKYYYF